MIVSIIILPGPTNRAYAGGCVTATAYCGYLVACDWLQLSNKRFPVLADMNVGAVVADYGSRVSIKRQAASLIHALVDVVETHALHDNEQVWR